MQEGNGASVIIPNIIRFTLHCRSLASTLMLIFDIFTYNVSHKEVASAIFPMVTLALYIEVTLYNHAPFLS